MGLLMRGHRVVEQLRLGVMVLELLALQTCLHPSNLLGPIHVTALGRLSRRDSFQAVGPVVDGTLRYSMTALTVTLMIHNWAYRSVDRQLLPVDTKSGQLRVKVGEVSALQKWVIREANTRHNVASTKGNLLGLREELIDVAVKLELSNVSDRH